MSGRSPPKLNDDVPNIEELVEACRWLKATGFPQYVQLYRNGAFPIDLVMAKADHDFLDNDVCKAFLRRIKVLNRHAMSISDHRNLLRSKLTNACDDDIALSCRWRKDPSSKKWSRDDTVLASGAAKRGQHVKRSCSTPINNRPGASLKRWQSSDSDSESELIKEHHRMQQAWYSSMDRSAKPKRERKQRMSFLNRFKTSSPRVTRKHSERKFEIGTPILNKGMENLKRYNCISIAHANQLQNNDSGFQEQDQFGTFPRRGKKSLQPQIEEPEFDNHFRGLRYLTTQAEKLLTCDGESLYEEVLTYDSISSSSKVEDEEISSQFDHCESLLSDLEFIGKPAMASTPVSNTRKYESRQGMESIKRQMDSLADMVNDLQVQMNKKTSPPPFKHDSSILLLHEEEEEGEEKVESESKSEDDFSDHRQQASLPRNYLKRRKRLRWRSFYTAHQPSFRSRSIQLNALSVGQLVILRKLAILKMTALIERFRFVSTDINISYLHRLASKL